MAGPVEKYSWGSNEALKLRPTKNIQQFYWPELSLKYTRYLDVVFLYTCYTLSAFVACNCEPAEFSEEFLIGC